MKRTSFLGTIFSLPLLSSSLWAEQYRQSVSKDIVPVEPLSALEKILCQIADESGAKIESCTGESNSHSRTVKAVKLPEQFDNKECWLCLYVQITHHNGSIKGHEKEHFTTAMLCIEKCNPISEHTQYCLAKSIEIRSSCCGGGGFGIGVDVRTCTSQDTGGIKLVSADVDMCRRYYHRETIHPLHKRVLSLFAQMTEGYSWEPDALLNY